jgi:glycosyltransferase involved in cell wall biosynthesis
MSRLPFFSVIIPVYNGAAYIERCLRSLRESDFTNWELIVVDDGSTDGSAWLLGRSGAHVLQTAHRMGPAAARNLGARLARGDYLFFIDADCALHPETLGRAATVFQDDPTLDALFGSYDDRPGSKNLISQYKNLFHHYVHQTAQVEASTFWTGCGAIRRARFAALGGFEVQRYRRPSVEDIDLGYRLKKAGGRIRLVKQVQVKHLKAWSLGGLLRSDVFDRGIPWTQLILRDKAFVADLNLQTHNRVSVVAAWLLLASLSVSLWRVQGLWLTAGLVVLLLWLNLDLYRFFRRQRGITFTLKVLPLHWFYYLYNAVAFGLGLLLYWHQFARSRLVAKPETVADRVETDRN